MPAELKRCIKSWKRKLPDYKIKKWDTHNFDGSSSNLVVISFLFQLSSSFLILLKVVDMFAF